MSKASELLDKVQVSERITKVDISITTTAEAIYVSGPDCTYVLSLNKSQIDSLKSSGASIKVSGEMMH